MSLRYFPFDSQISGYDAYGNPQYDRAEHADLLRYKFHQYFTDGVFPNPSTNFQVLENSGMTLTIKAGSANIQGVFAWDEDDDSITLDAADTMGRIDRIVLRLDLALAARCITVEVLKGTASASPVAPTLTRDDTVWEIAVADVTVPGRATEITQADIADTRLDSDLCGIVVQAVDTIDTTTLYLQVQADLAAFRAESEAQWMAWFENLQYVLDGDVAGHLQNEIDGITPLQFFDTAVAPSLFAEYTAADAQETALIAAGYIYKADILILGVTATMIPSVTLGAAEATGGAFAPLARCGAGYVRLYSSEIPGAAITIPTIICEKAVS